MVVLALLLGAFAAAWRLGVARGMRVSVTGSDGVVYTLHTASAGRAFVDPYASAWQRILAGLPSGLAQRFRIPQVARIPNPTTNEVLNVWLETKAPGGAAAQAHGIAVGDASGNFTGSDGGSVRRGKTADGGQFEGHVIRVYPRRSPLLEVRVYPSPWNLSRPVALFRIPNPGVVKGKPPLVGKPLPQLAADGDLEATLEAFEVGPAEWPRDADPAQRRVRLEFSVRQGGVGTTNWVSYHVRQARDGMGNVTDGNSWRHGWESGRSHVSYAHWPLPVGEPWEVEVEFCQTDGFEPSRVWELMRLPLRLDGGVVSGVTNVVEGRVLSVTRLGPSRTREPQEGGSGRWVELEVTVSGGAPDGRRWHVSMVRGVDSTGRVLGRSGWSGSDDQRTFDLMVDRQATSVDLWLAYAPSRVLTFCAQPEVRTNVGGARP